MVEARDYLRTILYTPSEVDDWLADRAFPFSEYDSELGYLHRPWRRRDGIGRSISSYSYGESGARRMTRHADRPCRVNTYGDSFTHCDQVSDGETWQEVLAAHLGEPIRNFGVGGYSVYQAYLRMKREEARTPGEYVVFNIYDDDHYRNLVSWQRIHFGTSPISFLPTCPHLRVDRAAGRFVECGNPCPTPESVHNLCDLDWVCETFGDDFMLAHRRSGGEWRERFTADSPLARAAIFASMRVVEKVEQFAVAHEKKVLYVLSYSAHNVVKRIRDGSRFDQEFVDFLERKGLTCVDLMAAHVDDYARFNTSVEDYLERYYIGHYNPLGNHFLAFAIKDRLVDMLEPKPIAYEGA